MSTLELPLDQILVGDCREQLAKLPPGSVDLIFADPPYNLQLRNELWRPDQTRVQAVKDDWDQFESFQAYDQFSREWLAGCKRVLKETGTLWVIGSYHNIFRLGAIMQDLGFWILNDVIWIKTNPMPNFRGVRLANAHETLIWAAQSPKAHYTFNYQALKGFNDDKQLRSDWVLPICVGPERIKENGKKAHSTQKPEALLYRVILAASKPGDVVLDPFFGSGTTGAVARKLHRRWIGIEREQRYVELAHQRIGAIQPEPYDEKVFDVQAKTRRGPRITLGNLLEAGLLAPGQQLFFKANPQAAARLKPDGTLLMNGYEGSLHQLARRLMGDSPCNGWEQWYTRDSDDHFTVLDELRQRLRNPV